ncbi:isoleucine-tRNA ligase [Vavraia culicis subsp. floridensis]|uniref:Probable isoleucine--tRNA ligase, cytoplasmic n=1 Tax=Vavraia culicis (isolate floridensis) TaxID=948595 RepID=L2GT06_VAVCU|nr:isoleucine-tRNA ligase [Vavraia culicis subsp. floridensis]ELA46497.1 isoleucine-tRNA ligase [Vavraia culicis subsp. floridensis]
MSKEKFNFVKTEESILGVWNKEDCFEKQNELMRGKPEYNFYDGPPFATGLPHYGHILSGTIKDTVTRFFIQQGFSVKRRFGWDCHGLPVEYEIDKKLNISTRKEVLDMGIANYNNKCRSIVQKYTSEWEQIVNRMGRWIDFTNGYKTMDISFMESVWYAFSLIYKQKRVYRGFRVMSFSTACSTPLSNFEANLNYREVNDPSVVVAFKLNDRFRGKDVSLAIWTTTPWTLPSNLGVSVHPEFEYDIVDVNGKFYVVHGNRKEFYSVFESAKAVDKVKGSELIGLHYEPPFEYFKKDFSGFFKVLRNEAITDDSGTGIVHMAPAFGEEDYNVFLKEGMIRENEEVPCIIDDKGKFTSTDFKNLYFKDADKPIMKALGDKLLWRGTIRHRYPYCWRSDTPLIYKIVPNWFIHISDLQEQLYALNEKIHWVPPSIKNKFGNWLKCARDWSISRNRFWGTPIPIWASSDFKVMLCISSIRELEKVGFRVKNGQRVSVKIEDMHREFIDDILVEKDGVILHRIDEVFDCWFESGSMPLAQDHWPFSVYKADGVEQMFDQMHLSVRSPDAADFIAEGLDQTRGWFYTLHVVSTLLFNRPAFKNIIVSGIVLASDGKKMSKRLKNYPDPMEVANSYGVDSLRIYLISSPVVVAENLKFTEHGVKEVFKNLMINWYNILNFYVECSAKKQRIGEKTVLDVWIVNELSSFGLKIKNSMERYELINILSDVLVFVDDLSNWYIRMNRMRIRNGEHGVLKDVLTTFSVLMAPFAPFFSEYSYQVLQGNSSLLSDRFKSVHYEMFPSFEPAKDNNFGKTKKVIESIRVLRENQKLSLKTPLSDVTIVGMDDFDHELVKTECNVLEMKTDNEENYEFSVRIKPNFAKIKVRNAEKDIPGKIATINKLKDISELCAYNIVGEEVIVERNLILQDENRVAKNFGDFTVILNVQLNDSLIEMKEGRMFNAFLQKLRKRIGLKMEDTVKVYLESKNLRNVILKNYEINFVDDDDTCVVLGEGLYVYGGQDVLVKIFKY